MGMRVTVSLDIDSPFGNCSIRESLHVYQRGNGWIADNGAMYIPGEDPKGAVAAWILTEIGVRVFPSFGDADDCEDSWNEPEEKDSHAKA